MAKTRGNRKKRLEVLEEILDVKNNGETVLYWMDMYDKLFATLYGLFTVDNEIYNKFINYSLETIDQLPEVFAFSNFLLYRLEEELAKIDKNIDFTTLYEISRNLRAMKEDGDAEANLAQIVEYINNTYNEAKIKEWKEAANKIYTGITKLGDQHEKTIR